MFAKIWIQPPTENKNIVVPQIKLLSRREGDANFLKPDDNSVLAKAGVGEDGLPHYVGAVPPKGTQEWVWDGALKASQKK